MAFPTIDTTPSTYASTVFIRAKQVRAECVRYIAQCDAGAINLQDVAEAFMAGVLGPIKLELATIALVLRPLRRARTAAAVRSWTPPRRRPPTKRRRRRSRT
jgi:hypothetical protein